MPSNITEYSAPSGLGLQPSETGINAIAQAARRIQSRANEQADALTSAGSAIARGVKDAGDIGTDHLANREISHATVALATKQMDLINAWNDTAKNADPNDQLAATRFLKDKLEPQLQDFQDNGFVTEKGQKWAQGHIAAFREHMFQKTEADMAILAGHAVVTNLQQSANVLSATAMSDPTSVKFLLGQADDAIKGIVDTSPNLKATDAARITGEQSQKVKEQIARSAVFGAIQKNPEEGLKLAADPALAPYVNGVEVKQFETYARQQSRLKDADAERAQRLDEHEDNRISEEVGNEYRAKLFSNDPKVAGQVTLQAVNNDPRLRTQDKDRISNILRVYDKDETPPAISRRVTMDLFERFKLPDGDARKITNMEPIDDALIHGQLTKGDFNFLAQKFAEAKTPEGNSLIKRQALLMATVKPLIERSNMMQGTVDDVGSLEYYNFSQMVDTKIAEYRKAGKNPHDLFDNSKPDFLGRPEVLLPYRKSMNTSIEDLGRMMTKDPAQLPQVRAAKRPGESAAEYQKRTGQTWQDKPNPVPQSTR